GGGEGRSRLLEGGAGFLQMAPDFFQTAVPYQVELPLGAAEKRRDRGHAEAVPIVKLEEAALLSRQRPEGREKQLTKLCGGGRVLAVLDPALDLAVDREIEH